MPQETVKVMVRCRPANEKEVKMKAENCVTVDTKNN